MTANYVMPRPIYLLLIALLRLASFPASHGQTPTAAFEVATVRAAPPGSDANAGFWTHAGIGRFTARHLSLATLVQLAYGVADVQIANRQGWFDSNLYDIDAKPEAGIALSREELEPRLQNLLEQRFHLKAHTETRLAKGYSLIVGSRGERLAPTRHEKDPGDFKDISTGHMQGYHWTTAQLAKYLARASGFAVVDQTGLTGSYDVSFVYNPNPEADSTLPSLDLALEQSTGLLLKPQKVPVETLVIDSVDEAPTDN